MNEKKTKLHKNNNLKSILLLFFFFSRHKKNKIKKDHTITSFQLLWMEWKEKTNKIY